MTRHSIAGPSRGYRHILVSILYALTPNNDKSSSPIHAESSNLYVGNLHEPIIVDHLDLLTIFAVAWPLGFTSQVRVNKG